MSKGVNKVMLLGGLTKDPEVRYTQDRKAVLRFNLACGYQVKRNGQWEDEADYVPCVAFDARAEVIAKYCVKGSQLFIEGKVKTNNYKNKDGNTVWETHVQVQDIRFAGGRRKDEGDNGGASSSGGYYTPAPEAYEPPADDMSFKFKDGPAGAMEDADIPF